MAIGESPFFNLGNILSYFNPRNWQWARDTSFFRPQNTIMHGTNDPIIAIDCDNSITAYLDCPHLRAVIDKKAEMFANGEWKCVDINDESKEYPDDKGLVILNNPNPIESREDFLFKASFYKNLFANNFIFKVQGSVLVAPKVLWHLPSGRMQVQLKNMETFYEQTKLEDIISAFLLDHGSGVKKKYEVKDVIYKAENWSFEEGKGLSKIVSLKLPINNLVASLKTRNVLTVNFGVKGVVSPDSKDALGPVPIKEETKKVINEQFSEDSNLYSGSPKMRIAQNPVKFVQMSGSMNDMKLLECEEADFKLICTAFGMKKDLFPFTTGATFENQLQSEKTTYQSTIQQDADSFAGVMTRALNPGGNRKYILSYDWLQIMKEDEVKEAEAEKLETEELSILWHDGIISAEEYASMRGIKMSGDGIIKQKPGLQNNSTFGG